MDLFDGFATRDVDVDGATEHTRVGGDGPPVLLLHGWPQTHAMWHHQANALAAVHTVVATDLRGYGRSLAHDGDFTFRAMAADQVAVMAALGRESFHVVGHDRGARTAHRMLLDHPGTVRSVALLDILPTADVWALMDDWLALRYYHWLFLAQEDGLPQRMIGHDPVTYLHATLGRPDMGGDHFHPAAMAGYEAAARRPSVVEAWCGDYAAAARADRGHDADLRPIDVPALVLWGSRGVVGTGVSATGADPLHRWRRWLPTAEGRHVDAGHYLAEERPAETTALLVEHLARSG